METKGDHTRHYMSGIQMELVNFPILENIVK